MISISTSRGNNLAEGTTRIATRSEFGQSFAPTTIDVSMHHHFAVNAAGADSNVQDQRRAGPLTSGSGRS